MINWKLELENVVQCIYRLWTVEKECDFLECPSENKGHSYIHKLLPKELGWAVLTHACNSGLSCSKISSVTGEPVIWRALFYFTCTYLRQSSLALCLLSKTTVQAARGNISILLFTQESQSASYFEKGIRLYHVL